MSEALNKELYIVISQTGSFPSKLLKFFTKKKYNHVSISFDKKLNEMYSFARYYAYYPFYGGFTGENPEKGTFKRFEKTDCIILQLIISEKQYEIIRKRIDYMLTDKRKYRYDFIGVAYAGFGKIKRRRNKYYCSSFVYSILEEAGVIDANDFPKIVKPMDFLNIKNHQIIYEGNIHDYYNKVNETK